MAMVYKLSKLHLWQWWSGVIIYGALKGRIEKKENNKKRQKKNKVENPGLTRVFGQCSESQITIPGLC